MAETKELCTTYYDELIREGLSRLELCDCGNAVNKHKREQITNTNIISSNRSNSTNYDVDGLTKVYGKMKDQFPTWTKQSTNCVQFLQRIELTLKSLTNVPEEDYPRLLYYLVTEDPAKKWVTANILDTKLNWIDAKKKFSSHFNRAEHTAQLMKKYNEIKQLKDESVQVYSDRFLEIVNEMNRDDSDAIIIHHYLNGLHYKVRNKFEEWLINQRIDKDDTSYQVESLTKLVRICIVADVASISSTGVLVSSNSNNNTKSHGDGEKSNDNKLKFYCSIHKQNNTHDTKDCFSNSSSSDLNSNTKSTIKCYNCGELGHKSPECTKSKSGSGKSNVTISNPFDSLGKRESKPPEKLTYTDLGKQASDTKSNDVSAKATKLDNIVNIKQPSVPSRVWLHDSVRNRNYKALVDTGAKSKSFIDSKLVKELKLHINPVSGNILLASSDFKAQREGVTDKLLLTAILSYDYGTTILTKQIEHSFELVPLDVSEHEFIIGTDLLSILFPDNIPSSFYLPDESNEPSLCRINVIDQLIENFDCTKVQKEQILDDMIGYGCIPSEEVKERASVSTPLSLADEYNDLRLQIMNDPLIVEQIEINSSLSGFCNLRESTVHLPVDPIFVEKGYRPQYKIPFAAQDAVTEQVQKWFDAGKITLAPPNCPYNSSLTIAVKKDSYGKFNGYRICLDTRMLNKSITQADRFQLPYIRDVLERFYGCKYFGEIDLSEAYLQFQLDEESQPYTAFTWNGRQYMFVGCPFGISLLPSYFQRVMCHSFYDLPFTSEYLDNVPFGSNTADEHKHHLLLILQRCNKFNLKVKLSAMKVCHSEMRCLGHLLTREGIALSPSKVEWIANCERPTTGKQLQSFLGMITFVRPNIRHVSEITASLEGVKNTDGEIEWTERMILDFDILKQAVATAPKLAYPDFNKPFHIATDASNVGIGGVLYQPNEYGGDITPDNIVAVVSKKLSGSELNYSAYKKELFAIVYCLRHFHCYVWGQLDVIIFTDHKPLTYIFEQKLLSPSVQQWLDVLLDYQFAIKYREGKSNILPDHLSRLYSTEYHGSTAWGVPKVMPWNILPSIATGESDVIHSNSNINVNVNVVEIEEVMDEKDEKDENFFSSSSVDGGENAEALLNIDNDEMKIDTNDESDGLVQEFNLLEIERRGCIIPETDERTPLIQQQHAFGHFGITAVCANLISRNYWWKGMRKDIQRELSNCDSCNRYTVVRSGFNPAMYITSSSPWEHIQIDSSVHLPPAPGGYKALLVIIDVFTGFVILRPIKTTSADIVANELWQVCCILGLPKIIQSDNGPEFVNEVIRALVKLVGIEHRFISPYNPRADGKVERSIQTVMSIIKKLLHGYENNWTLFVPFAQLSFNNKYASLTGSTPFSLMFGRCLNPIQDYTADGTEVNIDDLDEWKLHMEKIQSLIYPAILERTKNSKDKMIQALNKKRRLLTKDSVIPVGAIVMLIDPLRKNKFEPKYIGPYTVTHRTRNGNYQLKDGTGVELDRRVPPDQLKLVSEKARPQDLETQEYEIDCILEHRGHPGTYEYKTKFKGFRNPTWVPEENFVDTALIRDYWKSEQKESEEDYS